MKNVLEKLREPKTSPWIAISFVVLLIGCSETDPFLSALRGDLHQMRRSLEANPGLLYSRDATGRTLLHHAATSGKIDSIAFLLDRGAEAETRDRYGWTALDYARLSGPQEAVDLLESRLSLTDAILRNEVELIREILTERPDEVNQGTEDGDYPLHIALEVASATVVSDLLAAGADPNIPYPDGETPLQKAIQTEDTPIVSALLESGADPNTLDKRDRSPIYFAIQSGNSEILDLLFQHGANANLEMAEGLTPIQLTAQKGEIEMVTRILAQGGILEAMNRDGRSALYWATKHGHYRLAHFLEEEIRVDDD